MLVGSASDAALELRVGLAPADLLEVHCDEVIGVGLGLRAGGELLPGVLRHRRDHAGRDLGAHLGVGECCRRREGDLLLGQLVVDVAVGEAVAPQSQCAGGKEDDDEDGSPRAQKHVESLAPHGILLSIPPRSRGSSISLCPRAQVGQSRKSRLSASIGPVSPTTAPCRSDSWRTRPHRTQAVGNHHGRRR